MQAKFKLLDQVRTVLRLKHMSFRTEEAYIGWIKRFILFHDKRHPTEMGADEIRAFLSHLAVHDRVAASTQNVALNALLFLYRHVLKQDFPDLGAIERAKRPRRVPTVFTREERWILNSALLSCRGCVTQEPALKCRLYVLFSRPGAIADVEISDDWAGWVSGR